MAQRAARTTPVQRRSEWRPPENIEPRDQLGGSLNGLSFAASWIGREGLGITSDIWTITGQTARRHGRAQNVGPELSARAVPRPLGRHDLLRTSGVRPRQLNLYRTMMALRETKAASSWCRVFLPIVGFDGNVDGFLTDDEL